MAPRTRHASCRNAFLWQSYGQEIQHWPWRRDTVRAATVTSSRMRLSSSPDTDHETVPGLKTSQAFLGSWKRLDVNAAFWMARELDHGLS